MGAQNFVAHATGKTAEEAFHNAVAQAQYDYGHAGYTGTIAEKHSFRMITDAKKQEIFPQGLDGLSDYEIEDALWDIDIFGVDGFWQDKWGDAACIQVGEGNYYFFGVASS